MPRRTDLKSILVVGSGPIVIGQACEFDYSGTQAIKALREEGYVVVLINSNPATIMTDPGLADRTYVEPLTLEYLEAVIARERPDALLPTTGGQTALNLTLQLVAKGILEKYEVELIGASERAIRVAEDRELFREAMGEIDLEVPAGELASTIEEALTFAADEGYPVVIRPSFTLGGSGGGIAYNVEECKEIVRLGLDLSPVSQVLVEESLLGWKEYELEVVRDRADNVIVVCSIENFDPMGVHTGDSLTVAPAQTLTDVEYQRMRDAAAAIMRKVGVETGGSNVQFAVRPEDGRLVVIEMNPRVSRSSALASKATGYPIAKVAAKLAVGYSLDEISNDITLKTPAAFEPVLDYVVTKIPKFAFEKFPGADSTLGTQMKSVGEVMAIGRTFKESLLKALRSLEAVHPLRPEDLGDSALRDFLTRPNEDRVRYILYALEHGWTIEQVHRLTRVDPWFLDQLKQVAELQSEVSDKSFDELSFEELYQLKSYGLSDRRLAYLFNVDESVVRTRRHATGVVPVYKRVDTCAGEFESFTPYMYSTYEEEDESAPEDVRKIVILGSGPNRIGQGIEFDYCCCHASYALREEGVQSIMVNCNPETVSTDYDTSDRLYFEPLTPEDVLEVVRCEQPEGVIVQFGGQTPLNLTPALHAAGIPILGTSPDSLDLAEDRERFNQLLDNLGIVHPDHGFAQSQSEALAVATRLEYPVLIRPSFVLGGRAMGIVYDKAELSHYVAAALEAAPQGSILIDKFLENAVEVDVDALSDGEECVIAGIMQHIEQAGVHSGDSSCILPPVDLSEPVLEAIRDATRLLAKALEVVGLMNVQFAITSKELHVLEVNPRASRTVPFIAKATGIPLAGIATKLMLGSTLNELGYSRDFTVSRYFVKSPVFPFIKFPGVDPKLSPEMRSTGEVMGVSENASTAYLKAQLAAGIVLPRHGRALITVNRRDHQPAVEIAKMLVQAGFDLVATRGTAATLREAGLEVEDILKQSEGRPHCVDAIRSGEISLIVNTPLGASSFRDGWKIRTAAIQHNVPCITTLAGARAAAQAVLGFEDLPVQVGALQDFVPAT